MDDLKSINYVPYVIEKTGRGERTYDLYSRLLEDRIIFVGTPIDFQIANSVVAQLLFLAKQNKNQDIQIYINSPGGSVSDGLAIYDTMRYVDCDIATYCVGLCASMGAFLLAGGTKGKRYILPNSRVMIHQPSAGTQGTVSDMEISVNEFLKTKRKLNEIMSENTGRSVEEVAAATERDRWMSASEALDFGLVDTVIGA